MAAGKGDKPHTDSAAVLLEHNIAAGQVETAAEQEASIAAPAAEQACLSTLNQLAEQDCLSLPDHS